ncbi:hypothetical protein Hamer_G001599 [Homarus americanus]|uniref:Uncharacterized protein n=1 Tax=Homarus americanus TaxID=6706 RepID=A0A8J5JW44_HOMAM|nr:hypothetical protein Hamer_G001599 [Homarus americanus]
MEGTGGEFLVWWFLDPSPAGATRQRKKMEDGPSVPRSDSPENIVLRHRCGRASRCKLETGTETDSTVGVRERF